MTKFRKVILFCASLTALTSTVLFTQSHVSATTKIPSKKVSLDSVTQIASTGNVTFSPDGVSYLIQKNQNLYLVTNNTEMKIATGVAKAEWNQDGKEVIYSEMPNNEKNTVVNIWIFNVQTKSKKQAGQTDRPFRFFVSNSGKIISSQDKKITSVDDVTYQSRAISHLDAEEFRVSPNGNWIAYENKNSLSLLNILTGETTTISSQMDKLHWDDFAWKEDSNQMAYAIHFGNECSIMLYDVSTKSNKQLQNEASGFYAGINWLKNGNLVYEFVPSHDTEYALHSSYEVLDLTSGVATTLFIDGLGLRLSPDGKKITFVRNDFHNAQKGSFVAVLKY